MKLINSIFAALLLLALTSKSYAQVLYEENQSGFGADLQIGSTNGETIFGISPNYVFNGRLGIGCTIGRHSYSQYGVSHSSTAIRPHIQYLVLKQYSENPVNVNVWTAYQYNTFAKIDGLNVSIVDLGASVSRIFEATEQVRIVPGFGVGYSNTWASYQGSSSDTNSQLRYIISGTVAFNKFYVTPNLTFANGNSNFGLSAGIYFPQ